MPAPILRHELACFRTGEVEPSPLLSFPSPIAHAAFSEDGRRLLVLTPIKTSTRSTRFSRKPLAVAGAAGAVAP